MLKIRLQRVGRKHEPAFRLVLTDSKNSTKSGKFLEVLGSHDFRLEKKTVLNKAITIAFKNSQNKDKLTESREELDEVEQVLMAAGRA